jgi:hypothetical protein
MKKFTLITCLSALFFGSTINPAYSAVDQCLTIKKFKEIDSRTLQMMKKKLSRYENQGFILQGTIKSFNGESIFYADWYGKGAKLYSDSLYGVGTVFDGKDKRLSHLVLQNDEKPFLNLHQHQVF